MSGGNVRSVVETRRRNWYGELVEAAVREQIVALMDFFLTGAVTENNRIDGMFHGMEPTVGDFLGPAF
jgi:hypothetical protein